jgi:hypothetical protein
MALARKAAGMASSGPELAQRFEHLLVLREAPRVVLGEDELVVDEDIELTGLADLQGGVDVEGILDGGRETRSAGLVVSGVAVLDDELHGGTSCRGSQARLARA